MLGVALDENLAMIEDSIAAACRRVPEVMLDAEHFFDGYCADPEYAVACLEAARHGGARWLVLCDTNGGRLPHEIARTVERVTGRIPPDQLGIHAHNDTENAVANTLAAVRAGARQVQGTLNGIGERCGNANLVSLIPTLMLKLGYGTGVSEAGLRHLTDLSRAVDERLNRIPDRHAAYVGACAFTHKAGLHAAAVAKDPSSYEHVPPEVVGNRRHVAVSDQAGRANLLTRLGEIGLEAPGDEQLSDLLVAVKERAALSVHVPLLGEEPGQELLPAGLGVRVELADDLSHLVVVSVHGVEEVECLLSTDDGRGDRDDGAEVRVEAVGGQFGEVERCGVHCAEEVTGDAELNVELGDEIPAELYKAVAEVLVFVLRLSGRVR